MAPARLPEAPLAPSLFSSCPGSSAGLRRQREALIIEDSELVHRLSPLLGRPSPVGRDVAQGQPQQLGRCIIAGEVATGLDDLAQLAVQALDGVGGVPPWCGHKDG